jgi:hypothetical protein
MIVGAAFFLGIFSGEPHGVADWTAGSSLHYSDLHSGAVRRGDSSVKSTVGQRFD